jgi:HD-GYP domain-containing protein (c-di-GMP phosphodiesterase class II)
VPGGILAKPGLLTREEFAEIRMHPQHGFEILADCAGCPEAVRLVALQHHERLDGSGYPNRLTGEQLHPYSRIAAVADTFDAMTADRVYRRGCTPRKALLELYGDHPRKLDPQAVEALIRLVGVYPVGTRVRLNSGEQGLVIAPNPHDTTRPVVRIDRDGLGRAIPVPFTLSLEGESRQVAAAEESS